MPNLTIGTPIPVLVDLTIYRGDDLNTYVRLYSRDSNGNKVYQDLTGCTVLAQVRVGPDRTVLTTLTAVVAAPQSGTTKGRINLSLAAATTALLVEGKAEWDLQVTESGGEVHTRARGPVFIKADISHA